MSPRVLERERTDEAREETAPGLLVGIRSALDRPAVNHYLILFSVLLLTGCGLIMVLSASSITSYAGGAGNALAIFLRQLAFAAVGLVLMLGFSFATPLLLRRLAWLGFALGIGLQSLTLSPLGVEVNGSLSWIRIGPAQLQPAELLKVALVVWLAAVLTSPLAKELPTRALGIAAGGFAVAVGLVMAGGDLGTSLILVLIFLGAIFVSDLPVVWTLLSVVVLGAAAGLAVLTSPNRMRRVAAMFAGHSDAEAMDHMGAHWQSAHGLYALASGGWFGVGLGASREKWQWLPEAHNDFIFAIIGEELGLLGSAVVLALFACLGFALVRVSLRASDPMVRIATMAACLWIIGQAAINISVVVTLLPVIGVPLPFVSYGGSALLSNLLMVGILLSFARREPGAADALRAARTRTRRSLSVLARPRGARR